jgi:nitroreductase
MAMDVFEAIENRRSVRKYLDVPVEWDKIGIILESARLAPSAGNVQEWRFIIVTKPEAKKEIASAALSQEWIAQAPYLIVVVAMIERIKRHYGMRGERLYCIQDCAIATSHMMLAAQALGLGTCWVGAFDENKVQRTLGLPDDMRPQIILAVGYSDEKPKMPPRYPIESLVFIEKYSHSSNRHRIKDIDAVLWNFNVAGKAISATKEAASDVERLTRRSRREIFEKLKESCRAISDKIKKK